MYDFHLTTSVPTAPGPQQRPGTPLGNFYSGARFDGWDSLGTRASDADKFTADDLVAVTFLGVQVPPKAAWRLLCGDPELFSELLAQIEDRELAETNPANIREDWPAWQLWERLRELPGVDWVIAGKLLARNRPHLIPVYDRVVKTVTGSDPHYWKSLCAALREKDGALQKRLLQLKTAAALPAFVTPLRVFDVIAWKGKRAACETCTNTPHPLPVGAVANPEAALSYIRRYGRFSTDQSFWSLPRITGLSAASASRYASLWPLTGFRCEQARPGLWVAVRHPV